jgi:hypothetical protein
MMSREIKLYAGLLLALLAGAFWSWKAEQSPKKASAATLVSMIDISPDELTSVSLKQKDGKATNVRFEGKGEDRIAWVEVTKPAPVPLVTDSSAGPVPAVAAETRKFPGGDAAVKLVELVAPFQAVRSLGKLDEKQRKQFELEDPKITMSLQTKGGRTHDLKVGGTTFGTQDYYAEDSSGRAWLVKSGSVKPLLNGEGLMERTLHEVEDKDILRVVVKSGDREAKFEQQHPLDAKGRYWAKPETPDTRETQLGTWLGKARKLPVVRYPDEQPASIAPKLELVYTDAKGKELARFALAPREGQAPLVRTDRTRVWAESDKTRVDELLGELDAILR